jgi:hypothetical protein
VDHDRLSRPAPFEELDRGDDVVAGAVADVVDLARRVAMRPERDQEQRAAVGRQHLRAAQAVDSTAAVAVQQHDRRSLFSALDEPGPELLPIAGPEPVGLEPGPRNGRDRLAEGRVMAVGQSVSHGE